MPTELNSIAHRHPDCEARSYRDFHTLHADREVLTCLVQCYREIFAEPDIWIAPGSVLPGSVRLDQEVPDDTVRSLQVLMGRLAGLKQTGPGDKGQIVGRLYGLPARLDV